MSADVGSWERFTSGDRQWCCRSSFRRFVTAADAPRWFDLAGDFRARLLKTGVGRNVWLVECGTPDVVVKSFDAPRGRERLKALLLGSTARREWRACVEAEHRGIAAVRPLALGVARRGHGPGILVFEAVPGAEPLDNWLARRSTSTRLCKKEIDEVLAALVRMTAEAHQRGFLHRDGHFGNLLVHQPPGKPTQLIHADLLGARFRRRPLGGRESARMLAVLAHASMRWVGPIRRMRFLKEYLAHRKDSQGNVRRSELKEYWSVVEREQRRHATQLARRRDRRLHGDHRYFATLNLQEGWSARVALRPGRRKAAPSSSPDRSIEEWNSILNVLLQDLGAGRDPQERLPADLVAEARTAGGLLERLLWAFGGAPCRREFLRSHKLRHRDRPARLIPACLEHRRGVLPDRSVLLVSRAAGDKACFQATPIPPASCGSASS